MTTPATGGPHQKVSDLMDGRLTPQEVSQALGELGDAQWLETWDVYHLIGDVLRSPDLAASHGGAALVERLRAQLPQVRQEPFPLPLQDVTATDGSARRLQAANDAVYRWKLVAGVACLSALALWGWNTWGAWGVPGGSPPGGYVRMAGGAVPVLVAAQAGVPAAPVPAVAVNGGETEPVMLRDPHLDALLAAHWQFSGGASALGNGQCFLRNAAYEEAGR
jgi:sigma-E factor negative regulatory protein RseA